jgi:hypothetical protein
VSCGLWVPNVCVYILVFCSLINFYFRSLVSCVKDTKYKNINTHIGNPQSTRHKRSKIKGDLDTKYMGSYVCVYFLVFCIFIIFYFRSLVSCGLCVPNVCVYILVFCIFINFYFRSLVSCVLKGDLDTKYKNINTNKGTHSTQDTRDLK